MNEEKKQSTGIRAAKGLLVWALVLVTMAAIALGGGGELGPAEAGVKEAVAGEATVSVVMEAAAADTAEVESVAPAVTETASSDAATSTEAEPVMPGGKIQSITFKKDMRIQDALQFLAARYQKNIVPSSKVDGAVTVTNLYDVTFEQALDAILGYGFKYEAQGNFINVFTAEEYKAIREDPERMMYKIFTLYYITAEEAQTLITPVLSGVGNAKIAASTGAETEISGGGSSGGGDSSSSGGSLEGGGGGDAPAQHDTIVVYDFPENIERVRDVLQSLDVKPKQVLVEATILSALLTEEMDIGIDLSLSGGFAVDNFPSNIGRVPGTPIETYGFAFVGGGLRVGISSGNLQGFLSALEAVTDVTVLANPKILALNKQEGSVLIGRNLGYRQTSSISAAGTEVQGEVKFLPTGTQLVFRPYIANDGYIRMDIYPKDSTAELDSDGVPQETTTELQSNILVKDGETIVIGGLFRDVVTTVRRQVPLVGDIPVIGALFRSKSDTVQRQEVIILLTTHIIDEPSETEGEARGNDVRRKREGALDGLQSIGRGKIAEEHYVEAVRCYIQKDAISAMENLRRALRLRPGYLEAIRLKERILRETSPEEAAMLDRIILEDADNREAPKWLRR